MPSGGARKGAGRKPKPLAEKLAEGSSGRCRGRGKDKINPPEYLRMLKPIAPGVPTATELFEETVRYLEPLVSLKLVSPSMIADYAVARYHLIRVQYEFAHIDTVAENDKSRRTVTDLSDVILKFQKNTITAWKPIGDIISRNSERLVPNPEQEMLALIFAGRQRKAKPKRGMTDVFHSNPENPN